MRPRLATDLIHQPPQGGWAACGRERRQEKVERRIHLEYGAVRRFPMRGEAAGDKKARAPARDDVGCENERRSRPASWVAQGTGC